MNRLRVGALVAAAMMSYACSNEPGTPATATEAVRAYCGDDYVEIERRIDRTLRQLTLEQKALLVHGNLLTQPTWGVPGFEELGIPSLHMSDGPRGLSETAGDGTAFPVEMARGATFDPELEGRVGVAIAKEVRAAGRNYLLAPTMNVLRHPRWGRAQETYGEDSFHIGAMALGFVLGAQTELPVTAKHFAVNSIENTRHDVNVTVDERTLREIYLPHFQRVVQEGRVASIMSAYNSVNGAYCSENKPLLGDILKGEWGFAGFVVSDWGGTEMNETGFDHTIAAAHAGLDLEMFVQNIYGDPLYSAVLEGDLDEEVVDGMVRRLLRASFCHDLDTNPPVADPSQIGTPAARALAAEVAERSLVLLRNTADALPITRGAGTSIVVTGRLADVVNIGDTGSSDVAAVNVVTTLAGMTMHADGSTITHLDHAPASPADETLVGDADVVVVVVGLTASNEGEGEIGAGDRTGLALPAVDVAWIQSVAALSDRVVVVVQGGSAITMSDFLTDVEAVLFAWYPGVEGGNAIARTLYGDVNPSGRLPIVFPVAEADLPAFDNVSHEVTYGYFYGYRHLDHEGTAPLFPFGAGLSYTTYAYSNLSVTSSGVGADAVMTASVSVQNTGTRAGLETVQLYVGAPGSTVSPRSERELRAFTQVTLAAGETQTVTLEVPVSRLAYWDETTHAFVVEPTAYRVEVGHSSGELPLSTDFTP